VTPDEGNRIADILTKVARNGTNLVAVTDDAYFGLFYEDDILKESIFTLLLDRDPRLMAIKLDGATKENYVWGLRIGFVTYGPHLKDNHHTVYDALERKTAGDIRGSISNASHLGQSVMLKSLQADTYHAEKEEKFRIMKARALEVKRVLSDPKYAEAWDVYSFNSGYFMCIKLKDVKAETLRLYLLDKYGVGLIALGDYDLRIAFSCIEEEDIQALFETIFKAVQDMKS